MRVLLRSGRAWLKRRRQVRLERAQRRAMLWRGADPIGAGRDDIDARSGGQLGQVDGDG